VQGYQSPKATWDLPVKLGVRAKHNKTRRQWQQPLFKLYRRREPIYQHPDGTVDVLALRKRVEMVVLKELGNLTIKELPNYCGQPLRQREVVNGTLWSGDNWAALVALNRVKEVWVVKSRSGN